MGRLSFSDLPSLSGRADLDWSKEGAPPALNLQADLDWENFTYGDAAFDRLVIPLSFDGNRLFVPGAELEAQGGKGGLKADLLYDRTDPANPSVRAKLDSDLDVTALQGVGGPGLDRFLESLHFDGAGPVAAFTVAGTSNDPRQWLVKGHLKAVALSYKKIALDSAEADLAFQDSAPRRAEPGHEAEGGAPSPAACATTSRSTPSASTSCGPRSTSRRSPPPWATSSRATSPPTSSTRRLGSRSTAWSTSTTPRTSSTPTSRSTSTPTGR